VRIAFIGAGSAVFGRRLVTDVMYFPELREGTIALMDLDESRLDVMLDVANKIKRDNDLGGLSFEPTTDRRRALAGADDVIASFEVGSQKCRALDQEIPFKYGLRVCYSSGTQRVAQTLRQMPVTIAMCRDMEELCPEALLLQYGNPVPDLIMGITQATKGNAVGLCHSVQGTAKQIAGYIGVPFEELDYQCAGINHQAWYLKLERDGDDLYPLLRAAMDTPEVWAKDKVRFELMGYFGLFVTESSPQATSSTTASSPICRATRASRSRRWRTEAGCTPARWATFRARWPRSIPTFAEPRSSASRRRSPVTGRRRTWGRSSIHSQPPASSCRTSASWSTS